MIEGTVTATVLRAFLRDALDGDITVLLPTSRSLAADRLG
jgi:hypothetical protein